MNKHFYESGLLRCYRHNKVFFALDRSEFLQRDDLRLLIEFPSLVSRPLSCLLLGTLSDLRDLIAQLINALVNITYHVADAE
jgi:hypothetical protein